MRKESALRDQRKEELESMKKSYETTEAERLKHETEMKTFKHGIKLKETELKQLKLDREESEHRTALESKLQSEIDTLTRDMERKDNEIASLTQNTDLIKLRTQAQAKKAELQQQKFNLSQAKSVFQRNQAQNEINRTQNEIESIVGEIVLYNSEITDEMKQQAMQAGIEKGRLNVVKQQRDQAFKSFSDKMDIEREIAKQQQENELYSQYLQHQQKINIDTERSKQLAKMKAQDQIMKNQIELQEKINRQKSKMEDHISKLKALEINPEINPELKQKQAELKNLYQQNENLKQQGTIMKTISEVVTTNLQEQAHGNAISDIIENPPEATTELQNVFESRVREMNINRSRAQILANFLNQVHNETNVSLTELIDNRELLQSLVYQNWNMVEHRNINAFVQNYGTGQQKISFG
jgi:hypothetical protein